VPITSAEQQSVLLLHRGGERLVRQRTRLVDALRGQLAGFGVVTAKGIGKLGERRALVAEPGDRRLPPLAREALALPVKQRRGLEREIEELERRLAAWHRSNEAARRLATLPGAGPITAPALVATVGEPRVFTPARPVAAWLGRTPRQHASGKRGCRGETGKGGGGYLRRLRVPGARSVVPWRGGRGGSQRAWLDGLRQRRPDPVVVAAPANRTARSARAVMARGAPFRPTTGVQAKASQRFFPRHARVNARPDGTPGRTRIGRPRRGRRAGSSSRA